jgi:hypothetical protein
MNYRKFNSIEKLINDNNTNDTGYELAQILQSDYDKYHFRYTWVWWDIEIIKEFKEFWMIRKKIIITYDLGNPSFSYNNSSKVSRRISWNRWYKSEVNWRQSDDF